MERRSFLALAAAGAAAVAAAGRRSARAEETRMFSAAYLVKRKPGMSFEDYSRHQVETHVGLAHALPGLRSYRYVDLPPIAGEDQLFDGLALLEFDSREAHDAALASPEGQAALADLPSFQDTEAMRAVFGPTVSRVDSFPA